jgi:hypothetical protein
MAIVGKRGWRAGQVQWHRERFASSMHAVQV